MPKVFHDFDLASFWSDSEYALKEYIEQEPTAELIASIENELGFRLPKSYVELMSSQNGGIPRDTCYPTKVRTSWAEDHVAISSIKAIGRTKTWSLCGDLGSKFMQDEWEYPEIGICICDCPSAGHDMIMLDYRKCGPDGEPEVVHVDQERDHKITFLAKNFETFIRGLVNDSVYDTSADDLKKNLATIERGSFSKMLSGLIAKHRETDFAAIIRNVCRSLTLEKGYFALHADEKSYLLYDIQFHLYTMSHPVRSGQEYLKIYPKMIAFGDGELTTGGYGPGFIEDWLRKRQTNEEIIANSVGEMSFSPKYVKAFMTKLREFQ